MQDILTCAMGLDIHRDVIVACLAKGELGTDPEIEIRSFSTLIPEMRKLRDWVLEAECRYVAMESTGIYWQPIYEMLEPCFDGQISILVVNARHMKNVPGRKTDMRDAQWIATLLRAGLLKGSFIPDKTFRELRHLTRYRNTKSAAFWICALRSPIGQAAPAGGGLSPLGENSRAQKRRPTPIEICPLKAVCRLSGTKSNFSMLWTF